MLKRFFFLLCLCSRLIVHGQEEVNYAENAKDKAEISIPVNKESGVSLRFITLLQTWVRSGELNPGSVYRGRTRSSLTDISVRRIVLTTVAQFTPRAMVLLNLEGSANSGDGSFQPALDVGILDAYGEYKIKNYLYIGVGLHQWTGLSRLNVDGIGSILNLDQPLFQQATWNKLDRLGRVMGIYIKGDIGNLNYRLSANEPFALPVAAYGANSGGGSPAGGGLGGEARYAQINVAYMNPSASSKLIEGYFEYAFWEKENHVTPYEVNTYHGEKKLFNLGTGFIYRNKGIFTPEKIEPKNPLLPESVSNPRVVAAGKETDLLCYAFDATLMYPFSAKKDGIAAYLAYYHLDLGNNYYTVSAINPVTVTGEGASPINGAGNAFPTTGTGNSIYTKIGYLCPAGDKSLSRLGIFATYQHTKLTALKEAVQVYETGLNWFIQTNKIKLSGVYRNRPVYQGMAAFDNIESNATVDQRKGEVIVQLQFNF